MLSHQPVCVDDIREIASLKFDRNAHGYFFSGAEDEQSLRDNVAAFKRYRLRPRFLRNVSHVSTRTSVLGEEISFPVCVAPTGLQCMAHPDGERATARACTNLKTCMVLSSGSTTSIEDVGTASGGGLRWFQLYILKNRDLTLELIKRAELSGYKALVVTIDAPVVGKRYADVRNKFFLPPHLVQVNYSYKGVLTDPTAVHKGSDSPQHSFTCDLFDSTITWKDIDWVKSVSSLPVVLKGILSSEDALLAVNHGLNGIIVSNHGGRQLDGVPATIEVLKEIVDAVSNRCEVYLDGGVRRGTDVLKALALGARAVFIGRPVIWGLAYNGQEGVEKVLQILKDEFKLAMMLSGCTTVPTITSKLLVKETVLHSRL
jgi:(S)-2-hydroxy-acid oxidase